jgi:hypothetical protein
MIHFMLIASIPVGRKGGMREDNQKKFFQLRFCRDFTAKKFRSE